MISWKTHQWRKFFWSFCSIGVRNQVLGLRGRSVEDTDWNYASLSHFQCKVHHLGDLCFAIQFSLGVEKGTRLKRGFELALNQLQWCSFSNYWAKYFYSNDQRSRYKTEMQMHKGRLRSMWTFRCWIPLMIPPIYSFLKINSKLISLSARLSPAPSSSPTLCSKPRISN